MRPPPTLDSAATRQHTAARFPLLTPIPWSPRDRRACYLYVSAETSRPGCNWQDSARGWWVAYSNARRAPSIHPLGPRPRDRNLEPPCARSAPDATTSGSRLAPSHHDDQSSAVQLRLTVHQRLTATSRQFRRDPRHPRGSAVGSHAVMQVQLRQMLKLADLPNITVHDPLAAATTGHPRPLQSGGRRPGVPSSVVETVAVDDPLPAGRLALHQDHGTRSVAPPGRHRTSSSTGEGGRDIHQRAGAGTRTWRTRSHRVDEGASWRCEMAQIVGVRDSKPRAGLVFRRRPGGVRRPPAPGPPEGRVSPRPTVAAPLARSLQRRDATPCTGHVPLRTTRRGPRCSTGAGVVPHVARTVTESGAASTPHRRRNRGAAR